MQVKPDHDAAIDAALRDLTSADPEQAARAADVLYNTPGVAELMADPRSADSVARSVGQNNRTAAAILLLGYSAAGAALLTELVRNHGDQPVKLKPWSRAVPLSVAANAALSRLGDRDARLDLLSKIPMFEENIRVFLLDIIPYLDAPEIWHALSEYLNDTHEIPEGVPSGADRRRVCDHAVDAFLDRFAWPVSFTRKPGGRYETTEIQEVLKLLVQNVPR